MKRIEIGAAVLYLGDCIDIMPTLPPVDAVIADPPYGIGYQHGGGGRGLHRRQFEGTIAGDDKPFDPSTVLAIAEKVALLGADHFKHRLPEGGRLACWDKAIGVGPADSFTDGEFIWFRGANLKRNVYRHLWKGIARKTAPEDRIDKKGSHFHVSQKPVGLMRYCMEALRMRAGELVLDPYCGSGSTGVAALSLGLRFIGIEIDAGHFTVACRRIAQAQGLPWPPAIADARDAYEQTEQQAARLGGESGAV